MNCSAKELPAPSPCFFVTRMWVGGVAAAHFLNEQLCPALAAHGELPAYLLLPPSRPPSHRPCSPLSGSAGPCLPPGQLAGPQSKEAGQKGKSQVLGLDPDLGLPRADLHGPVLAAKVTALLPHSLFCLATLAFSHNVQHGWLCLGPCSSEKFPSLAPAGLSWSSLAAHGFTVCHMASNTPAILQQLGTSWSQKSSHPRPTPES